MSNNEKMIELKKLLDSKWWEILVTAWKERRKNLAKEALFRQEGMMTPNPELSPKDLLVNRIMEISYCIDSLPKKMIENPDYDPTKDVKDDLWEEVNDIVDEMFLQTE